MLKKRPSDPQTCDSLAFSCPFISSRHISCGPSTGALVMNPNTTLLSFLQIVPQPQSPKGPPVLEAVDRRDLRGEGECGSGFSFSCTFRSTCFQNSCHGACPLLPGTVRIVCPEGRRVPGFQGPHPTGSTPVPCVTFNCHSGFQGPLASDLALRPSWGSHLPAHARRAGHRLRRSALGRGDDSLPRPACDCPPSRSRPRGCLEGLPD